MSHIHNLLVTQTSEAETLLGSPKSLSSQYTDDVGFWSDSVRTLHAIVSARDMDEEFDALFDEVQDNHSESDDGAFVTIIPRSVTDAFGDLADERVSELAQQWAKIAVGITWHSGLTPEQMLRALIHASQTARDSSGYVAFHSYE